MEPARAATVARYTLTNAPSKRVKMVFMTAFLYLVETPHDASGKARGVKSFGPHEKDRV